MLPNTFPCTTSTASPSGETTWPPVAQQYLGEKIWLIINLVIPGLHRWANAPNEHYLKNWHRHLFHITCELLVNKNRQFEFIALKEELWKFLTDRLKSSATEGISISTNMITGLHGTIFISEDTIEKGSTEGLAKFICQYFMENYQIPHIKVTVLEDNENGAKVEMHN